MTTLHPDAVRKYERDRRKVINDWWDQIILEIQRRRVRELQQLEAGCAAVIRDLATQSRPQEGTDS